MQGPKKSNLISGASWPKHEDGRDKITSEFNKSEKKTLFCIFERRKRGGCAKGGACDFNHDISDEMRKKDAASKSKTKASGQPSGANFARIAAAAMHTSAETAVSAETAALPRRRGPIHQRSLPGGQSPDGSPAVTAATATAMCVAAAVR